MDILEVKRIWEEVKTELEQTIPSSTFEPWILPLEPMGFDNNQFSVLTGQSFAKEILRKNHYKEITAALKKVIGHDVEIDIIFDEELSKKIKKEIKKETEKSIKKNPEKTEKEIAMDNLAKMQSSSNLNLKYKFENFVVGENNKFAHAAAMSVAERPATKYNPLFIYGGSGLGKTHLMQAIGHYTIFNNPKLKVRYIKMEDYVNELIDNLRQGKDASGKMFNFRQKYRNVDILLIDDIQFMESKTRTMEEIFHTFDTLHNKNKQIVLTSDRLPKDMPGLPDRLRSRFEMGLIVDLTPPDFETRVAILANLAEQANLKLDFSVLEYIAMNFQNNVRELEGAFNKLAAYADIEKTSVTLDFAKQVLKCAEKKNEISIVEIADAVGELFGVSIDEMQSPARAQKISNARQIAIYLAREILKLNFVQIAEYFNKKHPTILFSYEKVKKEMQADSELRAVIRELKQALKH